MAASDFVEQMRQALALSVPDLDTSIGTVMRKYLDAVGEVADEVSIDRYLLDYQYDLDTKQGADLEDFLRAFGFSRRSAHRATGIVTFERNTPATSNILIPVGTQVATTSGVPRALFLTVVPAILLTGSNTVDVPIQAVAAGSSGNVSAGAVERFVNPIAGITSFSNIVATTGGTDAESDSQLRERFRRTWGRNLAGTEAMFLGVALENDAVSQANVVGASKHRVEQVELVGGNASATVTDAAFVYPESATFGPDISGGIILVPGIHYSFVTTSLPPQVVALDIMSVPDGIYDLEFDYVPVGSRNDPNTNITNRIDIYVNGTKATEGVETRVFSTTLAFSAATGSPLLNTNFERTNGAHPTVGNYFLAFANSPVLDPSITNHITIGATTYDEGVDYYLVNDTSARGGAMQSLSGVEWISLANGATKAIPADGTQFTASYTFNAVPREVALALRDWRLVTTDVWVHQAKIILLNLHLAAILNPGSTVSSVLPTLTYDLSTFISRVGFNDVLQVSDLLAVAHSSVGIDAARFLTDEDNATAYAIQRVSGTGSVLHTYSTSATPKRAIDVLTGDDEVMALNLVTLVAKAQNSFGPV